MGFRVLHKLEIENLLHVLLNLMGLLHLISKIQFNKDLSPVSLTATVRVVIFSSTKYKEKAQMELILHRESHCSVAIYLQRIYCKIDIMMEMMMRTR